MRARDESGSLPMHIAASSESTDVLQYFVKNYPSALNVKDSVSILNVRDSVSALNLKNSVSFYIKHKLFDKNIIQQKQFYSYVNIITIDKIRKNDQVNRHYRN